MFLKTAKATLCLFKMIKQKPKCSIKMVILGEVSNIQPMFIERWVSLGNTKGGSITVQLTTCLTGLD